MVNIEIIKSALIASFVSILFSLIISLALIKTGPKGNQGIQGIQGPQGIPGPQGNLVFNDGSSPISLTENNTKVQFGSTSYYIDYNGNANLNQLCLGSVCITPQQLQQLKTANNLS